MPGKRISELTALSGANSANNDDVLIFDTNAGMTKRISRSQLAEGMVPDLPLQYYLGTLNSAPTQRLNGDALVLGDYYLDAVTKYTTIYNGSGWNSYASVIAVQTASEAARDAAIVARNAAQLAETNAETAETNAELAETNAELAEANAETARDAALAAQAAAELAETNAETARDAAFVNANVYANTAAGLAAVALNEQFQVVSGVEIIRYREDAGPVATEVARYPSATVVQDHERRLTGLVEVTINLLNKDDASVADNFFVNSSNGNLQANTDYWASGFIPVVAGQTYYIAPKNYMAWYNANRVFISGSANTDTNPVQTAPVGAAFLRISLYIPGGGDPARAYVVLGSSGLLEYVPYGGALANDTRRIPNGFIAPEKTTFLTPGKNLFNKATRTLDAIQSTSGVGVNTSFDLSDFIPVEEGKTYQYRGAAGGARFRACFDASGVNVGSPNSTTSETSSFTVPIGSGVVSMRLSIAKARVDDFLVEEGAAPTAFEPFGFKFTDEILEQGIPGLVSNWSTKICSSYGDSLTSQLQWQPKIAAELGLIHTAYGVGGRQIAGATGMCQDAAVNTIPTDTELLLVLGGTNDWAQSRVLGAVASANTEEFYGALNQMAQKLTTRLPTCRIVWLTTPYGELPGRVTDGIWTTAHTNNAGLTTRAYAEAIRVASKRWGFPAIDLDECGWNEINLTTYMLADGGSIHPNATGGTRIAEVAIGRLRDLEPYA